MLEDNVRTPSGISYVVENRRAMTHVFPELFASHRVRPVADYPARLLEVLRATAPTGVVATRRSWCSRPACTTPRTSSTRSSRGQMGVELVEGRDLVCRDNHVFMRTTAGDEPVHVVYRRVDDEYLDPLHFRADSMLGCAGLVNAARAGNVTIANFVGNGVADDKAIYPYVPAMIEYYLGEKPVLDNVETYDLADPDVRDWALDRIDGLVWKPVDGSGGYGLVIGPQAEAADLDALRGSGGRGSPRVDRAGCRSRCRPRRRTSTARWARAISTCGRSRCTTARRCGSCPAGSRAVALPEGSLIVNSSQGGGSKDTWVLAGMVDDASVDEQVSERRAAGGKATEKMSRQPPDPGPPVGQSAAAQQQQQHAAVS